MSLCSRLRGPTVGTAAVATVVLLCTAGHGRGQSASDLMAPSVEESGRAIERHQTERAREEAVRALQQRVAHEENARRALDATGAALAPSTLDGTAAASGCLTLRDSEERSACLSEAARAGGIEGK